MPRGITLAAVLAAGAAGAGAPCPHPYFPMEEGLALTYRAGKSEVTVSFSDVRREGEDQRAQLQMQHKGKAGQTDAACTVEGIVTSGGLEGAALSMSGMDVTIVETKGVALPPAAKMIAGATWSNTLSIELRPPDKVKIPFGPVKTRFQKDSIIEGEEEVEIAGRTWKALRVKNTVTAMAGDRAQRTMESTMWLAPGVGILKIQTGDSVDLELLDVSRVGDDAVK